MEHEPIVTVAAAQTDLGQAAAPTLDEIRHWPATVDIPTANRALGLSRAHGYAMAQRGEYPARVLKVGGRYRVVTASIVRLLSEDGEVGAA